MRASTAAGINISLLPRDRICGGFPDGHLLVVPSGKGISFPWRLLVAVVPSGKRLLFLTFVGFPVAMSGERLLFLVFVWICR